MAGQCLPEDFEMLAEDGGLFKLRQMGGGAGAQGGFAFRVREQAGEGFGQRGGVFGGEGEAAGTDGLGQAAPVGDDGDGSAGDGFESDDAEGFGELAVRGRDEYAVLLEMAGDHLRRQRAEKGDLVAEAEAFGE